MNSSMTRTNWVSASKLTPLARICTTGPLRFSSSLLVVILEQSEHHSARSQPKLYISAFVYPLLETMTNGSTEP